MGADVGKGNPRDSNQSTSYEGFKVSFSKSGSSQKIKKSPLKDDISRVKGQEVMRGS